MKNYKLIIIGFAVMALLGFMAFALPDVSFAQGLESNLAAVGAESGLGSPDDPRIIVARIIRAALGFLGILATCIILYAGFLWMTAAGNPERVDKAKRLLINAAIGLVIILASVSIVQFVIMSVGRATGLDPAPRDTDCLDGSCTNLPTNVGFVVRSFSPEGELPIRNVVARAHFSRKVNLATLEGRVKVFNDDTDTEIPVTVGLNGDVVIITPTEACPDPNGDRFCYSENTNISVEFFPGIETPSGNKLICQAGLNPCVFSFKTGTLVDVEAPEVRITAPASGHRFARAVPLPIQAHVTDDAMVSGADFYADNELFATEVAEGDDLTNIYIDTLWDASLKAEERSYRVQATAFDVAGNSATASISVRINPSYCYNGQLDEDKGEAGIDCGGACGACAGGACTENEDCATGLCIDNRCVSVPRITGFSPPDGAIGTYVLVSGESFGGATGSVYFTGEDGSLILATIPACSDGWFSDNILVEVPEGAVTGPITLETANGLIDSTDSSDNGSPTLSDFVVNTTVRPGLCRATPRTGAPNSRTSLIGNNFGDERGDSGAVFFAKGSESSFVPVEPRSYDVSAWQNEQIGITVPPMDQADYYVSVKQNGVESNPVPYYLRFATRVEADTDPRILSIEPSEGAINAYVTIGGANFGNELGQVIFESKADSSARAQGSVIFPAACTNDDIWRADQVVVKVPERFSNNVAVSPGSFSVSVVRLDGATSAPVDFAVISGQPGPGVCAISPREGAVGDGVTVHGEFFGSSESGAEGATNQVIFETNEAASVRNWSTGAIEATVPADGKTGKVYVNVDGSRSDQGVLFSYGESSVVTEEDVLVGGYGWKFSTGVIPVVPRVIEACNDTVKSAIPNKKFNDSVCRNTKIRALFTVPMDAVSLRENVFVYTCTDESCASKILFDGASVLANVPDGASGTEYFTIQFTGNDSNLPANTFFRVEVEGGAGGALSVDGIPLAETFAWEFSTGGDDDICSLESVLIQPKSATITEDFGTQVFDAGGYARGCILLSNEFEWEWGSSNTGVATVADLACSSSDFDTNACGIATATGDGATKITVVEIESSEQDNADLTVSFEDPYLTDVWPNCEEACVNAEVGGSFNIPVKLSGVNGITNDGNVMYAECVDAECDVSAVTASTAVVKCKTPSGTDGCSEFELPFMTLEPGAFYRMFVSNDVWSIANKSLTKLNRGQYYSWVFSVAEDGMACGINHISISPDSAEASVIGHKQSFRANPYGAPDHCSVAGQRLQASLYDWDWTDKIIRVPLVAEWTKTGNELTYTVEGEVKTDRIAPEQEAFIADTAPSLFAELSPEVNSVKATIMVKADGYSPTAEAPFKLQCGARSDADCPTGYGVGLGNCCSLQPEIISHEPSGEDVCRNTLPQFVVETEIDIASAQANSFLKYEGAERCSDLPGHIIKSAGVSTEETTVLNFARRLFAMLIPAINAQEAGDCVVPVKSVTQQKEGGTDGEDVTYRVSLTTGVLLAPNAPYAFIVYGDTDTDSDVRKGLRSKLGAYMKVNYEPATSSPDDDKRFVTSGEICRIDFVDVTDPTGNPHGFFGISGSTGARTFNAVPQTLHNGTLKTLQPVTEYTWTWDDWTTTNTTIAVPGNTTKETSISTSLITPQSLSGEAALAASLTVTESGVTTKTIGFLDVKTFFCENPWPSLATFPFEDVAGNDDAVMISPGQPGEWTNFSTYYCRDAGARGPAGDLPALRVVQPPELPQIPGIQKEFLFEVADLANRGDVIGVRVISNPDYFSPLEWYRAQGFEGSPSAMQVDGFDAIRDGRTVYVAGARTRNGILRSNIYVISHNQNASATTRGIFEQVITNFKLFADIESSPNVCQATGSACVSNFDCKTEGDVCLDAKGKIARDMRRLTDLNRIARNIEEYAVENGVCSATTSRACTTSGDCPTGESCRPAIPALESGTFVPGLTASTWPSWQAELGSRVDGLSVDPLNRYRACTNGDLATCYSEATRTYACPADSSVYHYTRGTGVIGKEYKLVANLEYDQGRWDNSVPQYSFGLVEFNTNAQGTLMTGFTRENQFCDGATQGESTFCGDGIVGQGEVCEPGQPVSYADCTISVDGRTVPGRIAQRCNSSCTAFENEPAAVCAPLRCGNGVVEPGEQCDDGVDNGRYGFCSSTCRYDDAPRCGDGNLDPGEACDCGAVNNGEESGRSMDGEVCGASVFNGRYTRNAGKGCAWDCRGSAAFCGDGIKNGPEACDGGVQIATQKCGDGTLCAEGSPCADGSACGAGGLACEPSRVCQAGDPTKIGLACDTVSTLTGGINEGPGDQDSDCDSVRTVNGSEQKMGDGLCSPESLQMMRTRSCGLPGSTGTPAACRYANTWGTCRAATTCGNGVLEPGEECDDGNRNNNDACTNTCRLNVCGDGVVHTGVEACDNGALNGVACTAAYGASCTYCSSSCTVVSRSGAFCGDGIRQRPAEFCDGNDTPYYRVNTKGDVSPVTCSVLGETDLLVKGEPAICAVAGLCNGGARNGETCIVGAELTQPGFENLRCSGGSCAISECGENCAGACPFTYNTGLLTFSSQFEGAGRSGSIRLTKAEDFDSASSLVTRPAARGVLHIPACRQAGPVIGDVEFYIDRPDKAYVVFVNDLSGSMMGSNLTSLQKVLGGSFDTLFDALGTNVQVGLATYGVSIDIHRYPNMYSLGGTPGKDGVLDSNISVDGFGDAKYIDLMAPGKRLDFGQVSGFYGPNQKTQLKDMVEKFKAKMCSNGDACTSNADCAGLADPICYDPGTSTSAGMVHAIYAHDNVRRDKPTEEARRIIVLMTDGDFTNGYSPSYASCLARDKGYELYTIRLGKGGVPTLNRADDLAQDCATMNLGAWGGHASYKQWAINMAADSSKTACRGLMSTEAQSGWSDADRLNHLACISSGNPDPEHGLQYAYSGKTTKEFEEAFRSLVGSIGGAQIQYGGTGGKTGDIRAGNNVSIPLPDNFVCDPNRAQDIPLTISFYGTGSVTLSNFRFNFCKP